jgi:hypothetical protein
VSNFFSTKIFGGSKVEVMSAEGFAEEPTKKWKRKDYNLKKLEGLSERERAELETNRDLSKPIEQLVCDFHDIAEVAMTAQGTKIDMNMLQMQAEKRMVSLMGRVAIEHQRSSKLLVWLTVVLVIMTSVLIWLTITLVKLESHVTPMDKIQIQTSR